MKLTPEQLLQPRYQVLADYPGSTYRIGDIISCESADLDKFCKKYPAIFKKLGWWQLREFWRLPAYVKHTQKPNVSKVRRWDAFDITNEKVALYDHGDHLNYGYLPYLLPATEQEYFDANQPVKP